MSTSPPTPEWFDCEPLLSWLRDHGHESFAAKVESVSADRLNQPTNGDLKRWAAALDRLPPPDLHHLHVQDGRVCVSGSSKKLVTLRETLMEFHPWRKGPLEFSDLKIDTEWRSDWKWERFCDAIDLMGKSVLDVGCGNGYFGWRALDAGASIVMGLDPILRFLTQFEVFNRYARVPKRNFVVPMIDSDIPERLEAFDVVFSLGVLYHRTSPIDHLRSLASALVQNGTLVLETLIIDADDPQVLVPADRYAQMRNVWFLPSIPMLSRWLNRTGFTDATVIDVTPTTTDEQRSTEWMTFQSLKDFLDPKDSSRTIEGYPGPLRATISARRTD